MLVTPEGIVMLVNPVQPSKAHHPMLVTLEGIVMLVNPVQPEKPPMLVTGFPLNMDGMTKLPVAEVWQSVISTYVPRSW
jgi:hypothetical protein